MKKTTIITTIIILICLINIVSAEMIEQATGGTIYTIEDGGINYTIHTFTNNDTFNILIDSINISVLIVAGGGGGAGEVVTGGASGGGGAGGLIYNTSYNATGNITAIIGKGGIGGIARTTSPTKGQNSTFGLLTAIGGGSGGTYGINATNGGSGGGDGFSDHIIGLGTIGQGYDGGYGGVIGSGWLGGGGGGAGGIGGNATYGGYQNTHFAGDGGGGINNSINGSIICYAGGGGGGMWTSDTTTYGHAGYATCGGGAGKAGGGASGVGINGTGGGGGGAGSIGSDGIGGAGGKGIIIIKYKTIECTINSDCGVCEYCNEGICDNQANNEDLKDECNNEFTNCLNPYTLQGNNGYCDGAGACSVNNTLQNVSNGNVCINGVNTNPTIIVNCDELFDCITSNTQADGYYVGYAGDGTNTCIDTDWIASGSLWNVTGENIISTTEHAEICQEVDCITNSDCDFCMKCESEICVEQNSTEDLKDECNNEFSCSNNYIYEENTGYCDGTGNCDTTTSNVSTGNVCINSTAYNNNPTSSVNCGIWSDCIDEAKTANEYYVGYAGDGTNTCIDTDWIFTGTIWTATTGSKISITEHTDTCSEEEIFPYKAEDTILVASDVLGKGIHGIGAVAIIIGLLIMAGIGVVIFNSIKKK